MDVSPLCKSDHQSTLPISQCLRKSPASHVERGRKADSRPRSARECAETVKADRKGKANASWEGFGIPEIVQAMVPVADGNRFLQEIPANRTRRTHPPRAPVATIGLFPIDKVSELRDPNA